MERHGVGGGDRRAHGVDEQELPVRPRRVERGPVPAVAERVMLPEKARPRRLREALEVVLAVRLLAQREGLEGHARHDTVACDMAPAIPPLPDTLPADPLPLVAAWLAEAARAVRNSTAMTLATVGADGRPAARMVICRGFDPAKGAFVFYTDRDSDKGAELAARPLAALVFHWDAVERQVRVAGPVTDVPDVESDAYWASRPPDERARWTRPLTREGEGFAGGAWSGTRLMP